MNKIIEWIKEHPYKTAGIVFAVGILFLYLRSGSGNNAAASDPYTSYLSAQAAQTAAGTQLQAVQAQTSSTNYQVQQAAQVQLAQVGAAQDVTNQQTAAQLSAVNINDQAAVAVASLNAQVQDTTSTLTATAADTQSNNQAQVQLAQIAASAASQNLITQAATTIATAPYSATQSIDTLAALTPAQQLATTWARAQGIIGPTQTATNGLLNNALAGNPTATAAYDAFAMSAGFYGKAA